MYVDQRGQTNQLGQQLINQVSQYPGRITFTTGSDGIRRAQIGQPIPLSLSDSSASGINNFLNNSSAYNNNILLNSPPPIQVPYLTTPSPLQQILQQQRGSQSTGKAYFSRKR
jgi:hypothetical protein